MNPPPIHFPALLRSCPPEFSGWDVSSIEWRQAFNALFEGNPTAMLLVDPSTSQIADANPAAESLYLRKRAELIGRDIRNFLAKELSWDLTQITFEPIFSTYARHDCRTLHLKVGQQLLPMAGRQYALLSISDVTAQKSAEAAFIEVQRKYKSIFENAVEGFYINIPAGRFVEVNPAFAKMLGYDSPAELVETITDIATQLYVNPAQRKVLQDLLKRKGFVRGIEFQAKRKDGKTIWLSVSAREVRDMDGSVLFYEGLAEDVSDRKEADAKVRRMNQSLAAHMAQLERSHADLEQFAHAVSHDLKEPLRLISSYLTLLNLRHVDKLDAEAREFLSIATNGSRRMKALIEDLLSYSTIGTNDSISEEIDLRDLAEEVLQALQPIINETKAIVTVGHLPTVYGVRTHLSTVFAQLIENALKFRRLDSPCQIQLDSKRKEDHWLIEVRDNGSGVDRRMATRVFQIFQRGHSKDGLVGNGIGLAICRKIIELHGGRIWVDSNLGEGAIFFFTIPIQTT